MSRRTKIAALVVAIVLACFWTKTGMAHAMLVASVPDDGAALAAAPAEIVLRFNEPVMPVALRVLDVAGQPVAVVPPPATADSMVRAALPALPAGSYLVSWRVVSADSHPVGGAFTFAVGGARLSSTVDDQQQRESVWKAAVIANRAVGDAALLLAAGGALAFALVFGAAMPRGGKATLFAAYVVAVASALLSVPLARGWIAAAPMQALLEPAFWKLDAAAPHRSRTALIIVGLALAMLVRRKSVTGRLFAGVGALVACAGLPLSGHVATLTPPLPGQIALFLHAACAAFWIGALPLLALTLRQSSPAEAYRLLRRFSSFAIAIVVLLILAGIGVTLTRVHDVAVLTGSEYGRILLAKVGLVVVMLALAVANRRLTRALPGVNGAVAARLKGNIILEIGAAAAIVALTAWLGHTRPPDEMPHVHAAAAGRAFMSVESDGATLVVEVDPGRRGANRLTGTMTGPDGQPLAAREVAVELSLPAAAIEPLSARAALGPDGSFKVDSIALPVQGSWTVRVDALIGDFEKRVFTLQVEID